MSKTSTASSKLHDKHQLILADLLRDEDNKYCADCLAKGPRWASWNLGVFMCIRCAGIHRNLGVHISRVKSVNLDSWTPEQIESIQKGGNRHARNLYEANLPANFRRPQDDYPGLLLPSPKEVLADLLCGLVGSVLLFSVTRILKAAVADPTLELST